MQTHLVDINLYIKSDDNRATKAVLASLSQNLGIASVALNRFIKRLIMIQYNPQQISSSRIIQQVRQQGVHAALVGM